MMSVRAMLSVFILVMAAHTAMAQRHLMSKLSIVNTTTQTSQVLKANDEATQNQGFNFPGTVGTAGQVITIGSLSGNTASTTWSTPTGSFASLSAATASDIQDAGGTSSGQSVTGLAAGRYRVTGELSLSRNASGSADDGIILGFRGFPNGSSAGFTVECMDCPVATTGVPAYASVANGTTVTTTVNPGGSSGGIFFRYRINGVVNIAAAAGTITFAFNKSGASGEPTLKSGSYFIVKPLP